ncbi:MAG TPA: outer membrane beta-barrel domain-containing protein [Myxococcales bacterium]|nr:outer membrane beta-barrel domain-containing protein [Myxococcales bacterium]
MRWVLLAALAALTEAEGNEAAAPEAAAPEASPIPEDAEVVALREPTPEELAAQERAQRLVSGAPLYNPNVAVHIVQRKAFADGGKREVVLYPAVPQANGKFTQHFGTAASLIYHLHENFGLQVTPQYNWYSSDSSFNQELVDKVRQEGLAASTLLLNWGVQGGVEVTPLYGKFAFFDSTLAQFQVVLTGGAGLGSTRHLLRPAAQGKPASFGDTGNKFLGSVGGGFRVQLGDRFALRLEVRDLVYTARVDHVNGCSASELRQMRDVFDRLTREQLDAPDAISSQVAVGSACRVERFEGLDPERNESRAYDIRQALSLVEEPSSDVLNNVSVYAGFSVLF